MTTTSRGGMRVCCPDCSGSLASERGQTGYLIIEAVEVL